MPNFPIIDTHVHLWDPNRLSYSWLKDLPALNRPHLVEDYREACGSVEVEAMVFLECDVDVSDDGRSGLAEIEFVMEEAAREPRLRAIVASLPMERGPLVIEPLLAEISARFPLVRGIRRLIQSMPDASAVLSSEAFKGSLRLLPRYGYHFELCCRGDQLALLAPLASSLPDVSFILDHCGKPLIRAGELERYEADIAALAACPNVVCKLSDLPVEADHATWTVEDLRPYVDVVLSSFGPRRLMFGGDWPVLLLASGLEEWVVGLDGLLGSFSAEEMRLMFRDNAAAFYRL